MGIKNIFDTESPRSRQQDNWLKMVASIPGVKRALNAPVVSEDEAVALQARQILEESKQLPLSACGALSAINPFRL